jgi:two-component system sensor histidine kinase KdpD
MNDGRADPDQLLRQVVDEERRAERGSLVIFFGAAPGVGKTYAMLEAARTERDLKRDVVAGIVETHGRYETGALVLGLELLPRRKVQHGGTVLEEFDLDGALARKPGLILIDELAHTNAPGSRHEKRWQDVEEILDAGIDVYTTLNVQHIESLNDVVAQVTGVVVRETVPDRVLREASEIRLIDLPPDELLERLEDGKVYVPDQAQRALQSFFRKGNLIALRELALRRTAENVDAQMQVYKTAHGIREVWAAGDRVLVCVSPSPSSARILRAAFRMAGSLHAPLIAAYVETPRSIRMSDTDRRRVGDHLRLAEKLGGEAVVLRGERAAEETVRYARTRNVTKIVLGKPTHPRWRDWLAPSFLDEIVRSSGDVDVYVISGDDAASAKPPPPVRQSGGHPVPYAASFAVVAAATVVAWVLFGQRQLADVVMVYLLGIVVVAMRFGYGPSIGAAVMSVLAADFFFVPPYFSLAISDLQHAVTFAVMLIVAFVVSDLTQRIRLQADAARYRERRTASLYSMSQELAATRTASSLATVAAAHVHEVFGADIAVLSVSTDGALESVPGGDHTFTPAEKEVAVAAWSLAHGKSAGLGTDTLPSSKAVYLPMRGAQGLVGVLGVLPLDPHVFGDPEQRALLDLFASQVASALERARLAEDAQRATVQMEAERLRSSLLSAVSHDFRTPLSVITGSASALLDSKAKLPEAARHDLAETIHEEAQRLDHLVRNLLDMTRIASGAVKVTKEWQPIESVIGAAIGRLEEPLNGRRIHVDIASDVALAPIDDVLIELVLINLLENATKYTPAGSPIDINVRREGDEAVFEVADRGPGVPPDSVDKIFEKFYRLPRERAGGGAGLGLAICRGMVEAHGGRIWVTPREGGGASFRFALPVEGSPPNVDAEEAHG